MSVHIITDSTSDLTPALLEAYGLAGRVHIAPITVHFGDEEFLSGITISTEEFYARIEETKVMPRTSQPSPAAFMDLYRSVSSPGDTILSFHISSKMSGTYQSALLAAKHLGDRRVEVVDTKSASLGVGIIAIRAALAVAKGETADAALALSRELIARQRVYFLVDTLEYLQKNGRIGKAQALLGGLLNIKPLLTVDDGVVAPAEKVRGQAKARARLFERAAEYLRAELKSGESTVSAVVHARAPEAAEELRARLAAEFPNVTFVLAELGPTIGSHTGPGALGAICFAA